ncbi:hypothetical protein OG21DRAFT_1510015 [Imleria badia]|nr:hypothetical protein OG21DRAFT_1510015 [Imleria badia]
MHIASPLTTPYLRQPPIAAPHCHQTTFGRTKSLVNLRVSHPVQGVPKSPVSYSNRVQQRSITTAKMPFTLSTLISGRKRANRLPPRSPTRTNSRRQQKLYFSPGGHIHDRHTIPPDRLHISLSDPVLVAAEERLANVPNEKRRSKVSIIRESTARKPPHLASVVFHFEGEILSETLGDYNDNLFSAEAMDPSTIATSTREKDPGHFWKTGFHGAAAQSPRLLDPSDDSCDIAEVVTITLDVSLGIADNSASDNSRHGPDLAPLASETFKEELYIRGYLKRPASRSANVVPRKSRTSLAFASRKVFPKVLGRRQGRKVAESLRADQDAAKTPGGPSAHVSEKHLSTLASVTLRAPHVDGLESPGMNTATTASDLFDLHEFSYLTAFTTPPSSPSTVLDVETLKKGVGLGDSKHAV